MADDKNLGNSHSTNINSLIEKLRCKITRESEEDLLNNRKHVLQSTTKGLQVASNSGYDINKEITELENHIKKLQAEIVVMTETANKLENCNVILKKEVGNNIVSPMINKEKVLSTSKIKKRDGSDAGLPIGLKEECNKKQVEIYPELMNSNRLDDISKKLTVLRNDENLSNDNNFELTEKPIHTKLTLHSKVINCCSTPPSQKTPIPTPINNISTETIAPTSDISQIECTDNVTKEFLENTRPNNEDTLNENHDVMEIRFSDELHDSISSTVNDNLTENVEKDVGGNINRYVSVASFKNSNISSVISKSMGIDECKTENHPSVIVQTTTSYDVITNSPYPETKEDLNATTSTTKCDEEITRSPVNYPPDITLSPVNHPPEITLSPVNHPPEIALPPVNHPPVIPLSPDNHAPEITVTPDNHPPKITVSPDNHPPEITVSPFNHPPEIAQPASPSRERKSDGVLKSISRSLRKIVGIGSDKSIQNDKNTSEDVSKELLSSKSDCKPIGNDSFENLSKTIDFLQYSSETVNEDVSVTELIGSSEIVNCDLPRKSFTQENLTNENDVNKFNFPNSPIIVNAENMFNKMYNSESEFSKDMMPSETIVSHDDLVKDLNLQGDPDEVLDSQEDTGQNQKSNDKIDSKIPNTFNRNINVRSSLSKNPFRPLIIEEPVNENVMTIVSNEEENVTPVEKTLQESSKSEGDYEIEEDLDETGYEEDDEDTYDVD